MSWRWVAPLLAALAVALAACDTGDESVTAPDTLTASDTVTDTGGTTTWHFAGAETIDDYVALGARILVVGAHPDDESLPGAMLVDACIGRGNVCHFAVVTRGEGGSCALDEGCLPDLGTVRAGEMAAVAEAYGAGLDQGTFTNYTSDIAMDPDSATIIREGWESEGDPVAWVRGVVERFAPDVVFTFDPGGGFTGHVEHRLVGAITDEALATPGADGSIHPVVRYRFLNHYDILEGTFGLDPTEPTETWNLSRMCGEQTCIEAAADIATLHASQTGSVLAFFLLLKDDIDTGYLAAERFGMESTSED